MKNKIIMITGIYTVSIAFSDPRNESRKSNGYWKQATFASNCEAVPPTCVCYLSGSNEKTFLARCDN